MRISGLSSGMDVEQMVSDLVAAHRIPVDKVLQQKVRAEWKRDAYREVNTKLLRFRNLAFDMTLQGTYQKNVATSSNSAVASVSATGKAQPGSYELEVEQLAKSAQFISSGFEQRKAALFTEDGPEFIRFTLNGQSFDVKQSDSLEDIAAQINSKKDLAVSAFAHGEQISFTTKATGDAVKFEIDDNFITLFGGSKDVDNFLADKDGVIRGKNAVVNVNGIAAEFEGNTFDLNGIRVTLHDEPDPSQVVHKVRIEARYDVDHVVDKIKEFVNLYNELVDEFNASTREEVFRDFPPLTAQQRESLSDKEIEQWEAKAKSGILRSDPLLSSVLSEMRLALGGVVDGLEGNKSLAQIGIKTGAWFEYGRLYLDENKLRAALEEDPENVRDILTKQGVDTKEQGLARRLTTALDTSMKRITDTAGKASISYDQSFLGEQIRGFESRLSVMEERLIRFEESQWRKFTAMEKVLGQLYAQSDWLYQQLMTMQG